MHPQAKILGIIFLLVLFSVSVIAQPPFEQTIIGNDVLEIDFPKIEFFPLGKDLQFNYHVFNQTGLLLLNDSTSCVFHLFTFTGQHLIETNMVFDTSGKDFFIDVTSENLSVVGSYAWLVRCNNSDGVGGFSSGFFEVTNNGDDPERYPYWLPIILSIAFVGLLCLSSSFLIKSNNLSGIKSLLFLIGISNTLFLMAMPFFITLNPGRVDYFKPVGLTLLTSSLVLFVIIIWLYATFLMQRALNQKRDDETK